MSWQKVGADRDDPAFLFELRIPIWGNLFMVRAYEAPIDEQRYRFTTGHTTLHLQASFQGQELWKRGSTSVGIPAHQCIDGKEAKECALSLFALKPGDTDEEFFAEYTPEQLAFVENHGETISMIAEDRYGAP